MTMAGTLREHTFAALAVPNFRRYIGGQAVSLIGTWMQTIAQSWLVLQLTGSGTAVGTVVALQTVPILLLGPYGGVIADRVDKRRLMIGLQTMMGVLAFVLGTLTITGAVELWHVYTLAVLLGLNNCFEQPARQSFLLEMVGTENLRNAVSLQSVLASAARTVGPAVAGIVIAAGGLGFCFMLNAASFVAVVASLMRLNVSELRPSPSTGRARGQLREGLAYIRRSPGLAVPLMMMALVGCLTFEFQVVLPVVAEKVFQGGADAYGFLTAAMGVGAVLGGLAVATWGRTGVRPMVFTALAFGVLMAAAAVSPSLGVLIAVMVFVGALSTAFTSTTNSSLQLEAAPNMRGRVMALFSVAFMGSTAIGGPVAGWVSEEWGGRAGLALGASACFVAAVMGLFILGRDRRAVRRQTEQVDEPAECR
ncbi:MFS transporter [Rhodococcus sp. NPDC058521]|uniref:MFS transporter n=1 Tax=Rhodococcus sp. NPDC058521 TaxID=3346536 RepID=UPI00365F9154